MDGWSELLAEGRMTQQEIEYILEELDKEWIQWHAGDTGISHFPLEEKLRELIDYVAREA